MTYTPFADSAPINDNTGPELADITEKNLQALRDALNMGHSPGWDHTPGNGTSGDDWHREVIRWNKLNAVTGKTEQVRHNVMWGAEVDPGDFTSSAGAPTVTLNAAVDPDGGNAATSIVSTNSGTATTLALADALISANAGEEWGAAVFVKEGARTNSRKVTLNAYFAGDGEVNSNFDFSDESHSGNTFTHEYVGDGWYHLVQDLAVLTGSRTVAYLRVWESGRAIDHDVGDEVYVYQPRLFDGSKGMPVTSEPQWRLDIDDPWYLYGTETYEYDIDGNLLSSTWSGAPTLLDFEDGKPVNLDSALTTVDYVRENLMALRDCIVVGAMNGWDYAAMVGTGSAEEPERIRWEKGSGPERLIATLTWSSGRVDTERWFWRPDPATSLTVIGTKTYAYDTGSNVISAIWSGTQTYVGFDDDKPVDSDTGNTALTDIKNNMQGLRDGILYGGIDFWDYSKTDGSGTAEMPQYYFLKKGTNWIRATNTWGISGGEEHNIASQIWEYSSNSGGVYDSIGTLSFTYTADGAPSATTWS